MSFLSNARKSSEIIKQSLNLGASPLSGVGLVLGSGYAPFMEKFSEGVRFEYKDLPGFAATAVTGHASHLIVGKIGNTRVVCFGGRKHLYEGKGLEPVIFPVLILKFLGVQQIILTNAAGGANPDFEIGDLMVLTDHLDSTFHKYTKELFPLLGEIIETTPTGPVYDPEEAQKLWQAGKTNDIPIHKGVYALTLGPFYETALEISALRQWGVDAVGMSTIPEALAAWLLGMKVSALSGITNMATGLAKTAHNHSEVTQQAKKLLPRFTKILEGYLEGLTL